MNEVMDLINKLYGNQQRLFDNVPDVMGADTTNQAELSKAKANGYQPVKVAEEDSHRFSYDDLGYAKDAINNAKQDIKDIQESETAKASQNFQAAINFDKKQIKADKTVPANELVLINRFNNAKIDRVAKPMDIEMIYHNTHYSMPEVVKRHPNVLAYTPHDAELDAKQDLN